MNKDYGATKENTSKRNSRIKLSVIVLALLLLVEIYLMINFPRIYILLAVIGAASLFLIYRIANSLLKIQEERDNKREKEFESIFKSEKASYLLLRKNFADLAEMIYLLKGSSGLPLEELISAQKSIAKVTINKNRESSKALLNSTEELKNYLLEMNEKFAEIQDAVKENVENVSELVKNEVQSKNLDVIIRLNEMEKSINNEMEQVNSILVSSTMKEPQELSQGTVLEEESEIEKAEEKSEELDFPVIEEMKEEPEESEIPEIEEMEEEPEESEIPEIEKLEEEPEELEIPEIEEMEEEPEELEIPEIEKLEEEAEELKITEIEELKEEPEELEIPEIEELKEEPEEFEIPEIDSSDMPQMEDLVNLEPRVEPLTDDTSSADLNDLEERVRELQMMAAEEEPEMASLEVEKSEEDFSSLIQDITPTMEEIDPKMTPDEIEELITKNQEEEEFVPEMDLSNISEEIPTMEEIEKMLASIPMPEERREPEPEPVNTSSDSSHVMTPEEIAALIGETSPEPVEIELDPEPEPVTLTEPVSNDSNHVMTPDEIAALLASV